MTSSFPRIGGDETWGVGAEANVDAEAPFATLLGRFILRVADLRRLRRACLALITPFDDDATSHVVQQRFAHSTGTDNAKGNAKHCAPAGPVPPPQLPVKTVHLVQHTAAWIAQKPDFEPVLRPRSRPARGQVVLLKPPPYIINVNMPHAPPALRLQHRSGRHQSDNRQMEF